VRLDTGPQQLMIPLPREPRDRVKVGFTGSRGGITHAQSEQLTIQFHRVGATDLHHGDCRGADEAAHKIGRQLGLYIVGHPPTASGLRAFCVCDQLRDPQPYLVRNRAVILETELLIATPSGPERLRSGTWATIRYARRMRMPQIVIYPDGHTDCRYQ
jgi:hypothetical protein